MLARRLRGGYRLTFWLKMRFYLTNQTFISARTAPPAMRAQENDMRGIGEAPAGRLPPNAGSAIGPILFIIAILGILAAAIAAGSGSFTNGTASEGNSTKASALIQIGENLKVGMDRILMENGVDFISVVIGINNTSNTTDLFSPTGGGI